MSEVKVRFEAPPTVGKFLMSDAFVRGIVGPIGSGKSSGCSIEMPKRAMQQAAFSDGARRTRFAVIRNTYGQLRDTTRKTFEQWVPDQLGKWNEQAFSFDMRFPMKDGTRVESEVLFRALDRPQDVKKLLSLELTGAYINECREVPKDVFDMVQGRVGRYPSRAQGGPTWFGVWFDTNRWHATHWLKRHFAGKPEGHELYIQPGGRSEFAENVDNLPPGYYDRLCVGKDSEWIKVYVDNEEADHLVGSIYGKWLAKLEAAGRVCDFEHPRDGVYTSWDLGSADSTAIWFWRFNADRVPDVIDHYEAHGEGPQHYFDLLASKGYTYEKHFLPHDARHRTFASQVSVLDQFREEFGAEKLAITPHLSVSDGIAAGRWLMEQPIRIHSRCAEPCERGWSGLDALREYQYDWDEDHKAFSKAPLHNWASHSGDAWRYLALVVRHSELASRPPPEPKVPEIKPPTLDQLWAQEKRRNRRYGMED